MHGLARGLVTQLRCVHGRELGCCTAKPTRNVVGNRRDLRVSISAAKCRHRQSAWREASRAGNDDLRDIGCARIIDRAAVLDSEWRRGRKRSQIFLRDGQPAQRESPWYWDAQFPTKWAETASVTNVVGCCCGVRCS
jgi:hypothetical protein